MDEINERALYALGAWFIYFNTLLFFLNVSLVVGLLVQPLIILVSLFIIGLTFGNQNKE